jgi:hypothetical protein
MDPDPGGQLVSDPPDPQHCRQVTEELVAISMIQGFGSALI